MKLCMEMMATFQSKKTGEEINHNWNKTLQYNTMMICMKH